MILEITGAIKTDELHRLEIDDTKDKGDFILVDIPKTKNGNPRELVVNQPFLYLIRKYIALRPKGMRVSNCFLSYQNKKCTMQVIEINKIGAMPKEITEFLNLTDSKQYAGHSFRVTSATVLTNTGGTIVIIQNRGGWNSAK